ncbi:Alpha/Beta hydrolase protein [Auriculariales sp. MPI-PUGE-AT-0066]|nr:Alpha/Beta hydrolase protein [Auriculariales sp. MPI-PUGE-AT-0066]
MILWHIAFSLLLVSVVEAYHADVVQLPTGRYKPLRTSGAKVYYNIPYASATRFAQPQPIPDDKLTTIFNATAHGAACVNFAIPPPYDEGFAILLGVIPIEPQSEDCLMMDVWVPDGHFKEPLPVYFFIPGGGFLVGASFTYDFAPMLQRSVKIGKPFIAVAINYRLGPLGELNPSTATDKDINVGIWDQREALRYVQKHVHAFGGDPKKVTISGQSAGGGSALQHLIFGEAGLFRAAWMMSVPSASEPHLQKQPFPKDPLISQYAEAVGCPAGADIKENVDCLRTIPWPTLQNASIAWQGSQISMGGPIPRNVFREIRAGDYLNVPVVLTVCRDEATSMGIGFKSSSDETTAIAPAILTATGRWMTEEQTAAFIQSVLAAYPNDPALGCPYDGQNTTYGQPSQYKRMASIFTDSNWVEPFVEYLDIFSKTQATWGVLWNQPIPDTDPAMGVQHGSDLFYYFPTLGGEEHDPRAFGQERLVYEIQDALISFVVDLTPKGPKDTYQWPKFSVDRKVTSFTAADGPATVDAPYRPGFDVLRESLRPDGF